jgi:hypothetical protein
MSRYCRPRTRHPVRRLSAAVIAVVALGGCATPTNRAEESRTAIGPIPTILASIDLRLPVQDYLLTDAQAQRLSRARLILIQRCMRRFGFDYAVPQSASATEYGPRSLTDRRYGITDARLAATSGYGLGDRDPSLQKRPQRPKLGVDGDTVLSGQGQSSIKGMPVPQGGCLGEADHALDASVPPAADPDLGQKLQFQSFEWAKRDERVQAVFRAWSACMAASRYHYADPLAVAADPRFEGPVNSKEIAVALADIGCKVHANVVGVWFTVESAYQAQRIGQNPAAFQATKEALAARVRAAALTVPRK